MQEVTWKQRQDRRGTLIASQIKHVLCCMPSLKVSNQQSAKYHHHAWSTMTLIIDGMQAGAARLFRCAIEQNCLVCVDSSSADGACAAAHLRHRDAPTIVIQASV